MKQNIKAILSLTIICSVMAVLLAVTNAITAPIIDEQEKAAVNAALKQVLPDGKNFKNVDLSKFELPKTIEEAYGEDNGGYVFKLKTAGYGADLIFMCGIDSDGVVKGVQYISGNETLGYETTYGEKLKDATSDTIDGVETISGATKTTAAFKNAVKDALNAFIILGGGTVDIRDEATILKDNLNEALPEGKDKFTELFITEEKGNVTAVYKADNNAGYVFVVGETFVGCDNNGVVISATDNAVITEVEAVSTLIINSTMTEIDISSFADMPSHIQKAFKTSGGNYVLELRAAGYGIKGDKYVRSNEYININVSVTPDGKIISCKTISQKESSGIGDACADPDFYNQFSGKDESNYTEIGAISGATITTDGYKSAIASVFTAVKLLKGGA